MRISSALPLLPAVVLMATGCSGAGPDGDRAAEQHVAIADQAERVADLLEAERTCEAAEALRALEDLAGDGGASQDVRAAVESFVGSARTSVTCASPTPAPPPADPGPPEGEDRGNGDEGPGNDQDRGDEGEGNEGKGKGKDKDDEGERGGDDD